ncbi:MAG: hypothetical protein C0501_18920 [Isosphaera sp.]|nr:hypothetical protein [Isosphaera sp.]
MRLSPAAGLTLLASGLLAIALLLAPDAVPTSAAADEQPESAKDVLRAAGVEAGLSVHLGTTDGAFEVEAATGGRRVVHGLTLDAKHAEAARKLIRDRALYGPAAVERVASFDRLPYADNLVNLLVADLDALGEKAPPAAEVTRVLAPNGVSYLRRGGKWARTVKPLPKGSDDWSHFYHGPDGNPVSQDEVVGPPTGLQWLAGVVGTGASPTTGFRLSGGRAVYEWEPPGGSKMTPRTTYLVCRDAHSGVVLWSKATTAKPYKTRPIVMTAERVFTYVDENGPLVGLDAATGEVVTKFDKGGRPGKLKNGGESDVNLVLHEGTLLQTAGKGVYALDAKAGDLRWKHEEAEGAFVDLPTVAADKGLVFVTSGARGRDAGRYPGSDAKEILALDLKTGKKKWACPIDHELSQTVYQDGSLYAFNLSGFIGRRRDLLLARIDPADGKVVWKVNPDSKGQLLDMVLVDKKIYVMSLALEVYNAADGKKLGAYPMPGNSRCDMSRASRNYLLMSMGNFIDVKTDPLQLERAEISRGTCGTGHTPGYGMLFYSPNRCQCFVSVRGFMATSREKPREPVADGTRLEVAPAAKLTEATKPAAWPAAGEWPTYLANPKRSSSTSDALPAKLREVWKAAVEPVPARDAGPIPADAFQSSNFNGPASAPVVAGGRLYVAAPEAHRVECRDAATGKKVWEFTAGGRVDTPPTVYAGRCLFGCRDGRVYALDAATGAPQWKFLAAPYERNLVAYNQVESSWPLFGSTAVVDGTLVVAAGHHPESNGGIYCYGLEPGTGKLLWKYRVHHERAPGELGKKIPDAGETTRRYGYNANKVLNDVLISDGTLVSMTGFILDAKTGKSADPPEPPKPRDKPQPLPVHPMPFYLDFGFRPPYRNQQLEEYGGPGADHGSWVFRLTKPKLEVHGETIAFNDTRVAVTRVAGVEWALWDTTKEKEKDLPGRQNSSAPPDWLAKRNEYKGLYPKAVILAADKMVVGLSSPPDRNGAKTGELRVFSTTDGTELAVVPLDAGVIQAGLAAAGGRLYVTCEDGTVRCFGE